MVFWSWLFFLARLRSPQKFRHNRKLARAFLHTIIELHSSLVYLIHIELLRLNPN